MMRSWIAMPIDAKKDEPTAFGDIVRCTGCGLARSAKIPDPGEIAGFYDLAAYYTHGESHMRPARSSLLDRMLVRLAWQVDRAQPVDLDALAQALPAGGTVLDLGCGDGEKLEALSNRGFSVLGVDPDPQSRAFVATKGLTALAGTAEDPPKEIEGRRFDLVIMSHSLEHCRDPVRALDRANRLMAPGGLAYIEVPNAGCRHFETFRQCSEMFDAPRHLWFFTHDSLRMLAEQSGLTVERWHYNGFTRLFTPAWRGWECEIFNRLMQRGMARGAVRHSRLQSLRLLARSAFAPAHRKYDSIGILASRGQAALEMSPRSEMRIAA
jgi:SAM-dependent methyltransferase